MPKATSITKIKPKGVSKTKSGKPPPKDTRSEESPSLNDQSVSSADGSFRKLRKRLKVEKKAFMKKIERGDTSNSSIGSSIGSSISSRASLFNDSIRAVLGKRKLFEREERGGKREKLADRSQLPPIPVPHGTPSRTRAGKASRTPVSSTTDSEASCESAWTRHTGQDSLHDSLEEASKLFDFLIKPVTSSKFFNDIWEKKPLLVRRHKPNYYDGLFSTSDFDRILREEKLFFTRDVDVQTYSDDVTQRHNPEGPARAPLVWNFFQQGCSVRLSRPQAHSHRVHATLALLQEFFASAAEASVQLTPHESQGCAPLFEDAESFIVQLEGSQECKIYEPTSQDGRLPRYSREDIASSELGAPVLEVVLQRGDMLYFPRGFIHQERTQKEGSSLHMTIQVARKNTWADLLAILIPRALEQATQECVELRQGLPTDYLQYMGVVHSEEDNQQRKDFTSRLSLLLSKLLQHAPIDSSVDQMAKKFISASLPPCLSAFEKECSIEGGGRPWQVGGKLECTELTLDSEVKVVRRGCIRLVTEDQVFIHHNIDNSSDQRATSAPVQVSPEEAEAVEALIRRYPAFSRVNDLPMPDHQAKIDLAQLLYDRGMIITRSPLAKKNAK